MKEYLTLQINNHNDKREYYEKIIDIINKNELIQISCQTVITRLTQLIRNIAFLNL